LKKILVILAGVLALIYILNPGAGLFELIPDNLPLVGNLDEAAAVALLLMCLRYFGIDLTNLFRRNRPDNETLDRK
jgi:uncharacterized membrane protein YkvA (DUF1232 family)